jgi:hypothetical protein
MAQAAAEAAAEADAKQRTDEAQTPETKDV